MMNAVKAVGKYMLSAAPSELSIGNITRRVLFLIREEYSNQLRLAEDESHKEASSSSSSSSSSSQPRRLSKQKLSLDMLPTDISDSNDTTPIPLQSKPSTPTSPFKRTESLTYLSPSNLLDPTLQPSLGRVLSQVDSDVQSKDDIMFGRMFPNLRQSVIAEINELHEEVDTVVGTICESAQEHIHADECILAYGYSVFVESFLKAAARKRRFTVIIAECSPGLEGHRLANSLAKHANISVTLIPDANIYAIMCRVNKVIMSAHAVMADGGAICVNGNLMIAMAAKDFSVPVVCVAGTVQLTPLFAHNQVLALSQLLSPASIIPYNSPVNFENVEVAAPAYDFVPPDNISLYVTNQGSHQPSYVYRLLSEFYHPQDYNI